MVLRSLAITIALLTLVGLLASCLVMIFKPKNPLPAFMITALTILAVLAVTLLIAKEEVVGVSEAVYE